MPKFLAIFLALMLGCSPCFGGVDFGLEYPVVDFCKGPEESIGSNLTLSAWVYRKADENADEQIIAKDDHTFGEREFQFRISTGDKLQCIIFWSGNISTAESTAKIPLTTWTHVACSFDGETVKTFINGSPDGTNTDPNDGADTSTDMICLNGRCVNGGAIMLEGGYLTLSEVSIFSAALTAGKIKMLALSGVKRTPLQMPNLWAYYPLDDFADGTALNTNANAYKDISGNERHLSSCIDANSNGFNLAEQVLSYP